MTLVHRSRGPSPPLGPPTAPAPPTAAAEGLSGVSPESGGPRPRRSWWSLFGRKSSVPAAIPASPEAPPTPATPAREAPPQPNLPPKPPLFVADLLIMSTLDQKSPPVTPGTNDLLDSLVNDHIARASRQAEGEAGAPAAGHADGPADHAKDEPAQDATAADPTTVTASDGALAETSDGTEPAGAEEDLDSLAERTQLLQRQIQALLAGEPSADAAIERVPGAVETNSTAPAEDAVAKDLAGEAPAEASAAGRELTDAELEVLLKDPPGAPSRDGDKTAARAAAGQTDATRVATSPAAATAPAAGASATVAAAAPAAAGEAKTAVSVDEAVAAESLQAAEALVPVPAASQPVADEDVDAKLTEAEGVMAEELAQLMAETQAAESQGSDGANWSGKAIERSGGGSATEVTAPGGAASEAAGCRGTGDHGQPGDGGESDHGGGGACGYSEGGTDGQGCGECRFTRARCGARRCRCGTGEGAGGVGSRGRVGSRSFARRGGHDGSDADHLFGFTGFRRVAGRDRAAPAGVHGAAGHVPADPRSAVWMGQGTGQKRDRHRGVLPAAGGRGGLRLVAVAGVALRMGGQRENEQVSTTTFLHGQSACTRSTAFPSRCSRCGQAGRRAGGRCRR